MAQLPGGITGQKGGGGVRQMLMGNLSTARTVLMPGKREMAALGRRFRGGGGGLTGMWGAGKAYFGAGVGPGTVGMLQRHWQGGGLSALEAKGGLGFRRAAGGGALGAAMLGTSMLTGWSVFDQAQAIAGGGLMGRHLSAWAQRGGVGRQIGLGGAMAGAAFGAQYLSVGEIALGAAGYGAVRGAQAIARATAGPAPGLSIGKFPVRKGPFGPGIRTRSFGGGWARAAGAAAGIGLGLLI